MIEQQGASRDEAQGQKAVQVTIRTPAGISQAFEVRPHDRVDKTVRTAVAYFVEQGHLADGPYGLALVRDGQATEMIDTGRLEDYGVVENEVLHLIAKGPQVDG